MEGQTSAPFWLGRGKKFVKVFSFSKLDSAVSFEFWSKEKVPSQSALVRELMHSGFFICQNFLVSEKSPQAFVAHCSKKNSRLPS